MGYVSSKRNADSFFAKRRGFSPNSARSISMLVDEGAARNVI